jgi:hypothetical protein
MHTIAAERCRYSTYRILGETIRFSHGHMRRLLKLFINNFRRLCDQDDRFSTNCPQKMWTIQKACHILFLFFLFFSFLGLSACSQGKGVERFKALPAGTSLMAKGDAEVRKTLGEPDVVSKTPENRILWMYKPSWKVVPSPKDTLYVEFDDGKVAKVFQIK